MKILFTLTPAFDPNAGGVQRSTYKLGKYFTEHGMEVAYFSLAHKGHVTAEFGRLHTAPQAGSDKNPANLAALEDLLASFGPTIVINQMPYNNGLQQTLSRCKRKLGYSLIGCLRNSLFSFKNNVRDQMQRMLPGPLFKALDNRLGIAIIEKWHRVKHSKSLRSIIDAHDYFVLLAPPNREELQYFVGDYKQEKIVSIPNSIPAVLPEVPPKEKVILHVGRINVAQKRSDLLLDFWEQAATSLPDWRFIIVGGGPYYDKLAADLKTRGLERVELLGHQKPEEYYRQAAIFMMPSAFEGFPNTIIEAQSYGCAALAFDSYIALSWIVGNERDAFLSPSFDTQVMARHAVDLAQNDEKRRMIQEQALLNARRFTIEVVGKQWVGFFNEITKP